MTGLPSDLANINSVNLQYLHNELIPGCVENAFYAPFASEYLKLLRSRFAGDVIHHLDQLLLDLVSAGQGERATLVARFEAEHPAAFKQLYGDLLTAFYSAPETAARVQALADSGPREPSPNFDPVLLSAVIGKQSGQRRL